MAASLAVALIRSPAAAAFRNARPAVRAITSSSLSPGRAAPSGPGRRRRRPPGASPLGASAASWDDGPASRPPPYSTSASPSAGAATRDDSAYSRSSLPFSSPRASADDSLPSAMSSPRDGALEWGKLGLLTELVDAVVRDVDSGGLGLADGPTPVQRLAVPAILSGCADRMASPEGAGQERRRPSSSSSFDVDVTSEGPPAGGAATAIPPVQSVAFAAATGSGKTLGYLLPVIQSLRAQELAAQSAAPSESLSMEALARLRRPRRPRAVVLAPTRELARQILGVLKGVSHTCKISSELVVGGDDYGRQRRRLADRPVDVLVATPGRLAKHRDAGDVFLGSVRHVVIDEMDTMLEQGFQDDIGGLLHPMLYKRKSVRAGERPALVDGAPQIILTTATMTPAVRRALDSPDLPFEPKRTFGKKQNDPNSNDGAAKIALPGDIRVLTAPGLHRVVPRLKQVFVNVGSADKLSLLVDVVSGGERQKREGRRRGDGGGPLPLTLVFCNTVSSCRAAEHALAESGVTSLCYHGDLKSEEREENLDVFRKVGGGEWDGGGDEGGPSVLVCTDIASRGLDVPEVDHVVMFDFPLNPIDYLHRGEISRRNCLAS